MRNQEMSQRITDSLEVLKLIRKIARQNPQMSACSWRREAVADVAASRDVEPNTIFAHLSGKNEPPHTLGARELDLRIKAWINDGSSDLEKWILLSCKNHDKNLVLQFFSNEQSTPLATDIEEPETTERQFVTTYRVLRDTALAREIKVDNNYKCQICGEGILLAEDKPYAEAHHVKPLGSPHNGPDHRDNIVCVCPNCHVKLDYGAIEIDQNRFENVLLPEFIRYHNKVIHKKTL